MTCAFPGCGAALRHDNRSGVCARHMHRAGICRCTACVQAPRDEGPRHTVAGIPVRVATTAPLAGTIRDTHPRADVTLPREPWA